MQTQLLTLDKGCAGVGLYWCNFLLTEGHGRSICVQFKAMLSNFLQNSSRLLSLFPSIHPSSVIAYPLQRHGGMESIQASTGRVAGYATL